MRIMMPDIMKVEHNVRVLQEAKSLMTRGYNVTIIGFSNKSKKRCFRVSDVDVISFYLHDSRSGFGAIYRIFTAIRMILLINLYVIFSKADVYHAHNFHVLPACTISALFHGGKLIYDTHESWTIHRVRKNHPEHLSAFIAEKVFLRFIDGFITVNEMVGDYYKKKYSVDSTVILYNCRPLIPVRANELIKNEAGIDQAKKVALFVGGFWPTGRGIFELIQCARYVDEDVAIVLIGYGSENMITKMKNEVKLVKGEDKVFILPPKTPDQVMRYIMGADIGINLIKREGPAQDFQSPWKLFEYCMGGLAVISTDLPFHRKINKLYNIGPVVRVENDPQEIALKINELISDEKLLKTYKNNARFAAENEFNWENQEAKLAKLYDSLTTSGIREK
jgi:glycosyltransferase involved in cell wall biosynthesis